MIILVLGSQILAVSPQESEDSWFTAEQILPKSIVGDAILVEIEDVPNDFNPFEYECVEGEIVKKQASARTAVPQFASPRQIRQALTRAGLREAVEAAIASGSQDIKDWYEFATEFSRQHEDVALLAEALNVSEEDLDNLWILAASL